MAKRNIVPAPSSSSAAAPAAAEMSVCCSLVDEDQLFHGRDQQERLSGEEAAPQPESSACSSALDATMQLEPQEWPFLCPFCCSAKLTDPVALHAPVEAHAVSGSTAHCLGCRTCAERWHGATRVWDESASPSPDGDGCVHSSRTSLSSPCVTCPLCDCAVPTATVDSFVSLNASAQRDQKSAILRHPEMIRNCYTGLVPLSKKSGDTAVKGFQSTTSAAALYCGVCEEQKATRMCVQCDFGLCDACHDATHSKGKFKLHEMVALDQARRRDQLKCREHAGMLLDLYCETCATCVCVTCCFGGAHRGHEVFTLADIAQRTAAVLKEEAQELSTPREMAAAARTELAALWPLYKSKVSAVEGDIQRCFSRLRGVLQEREDALLKALGTASADVERRSTRLLSAAGALADLLDDASGRLESFHEAVNPATLMRVAQRLREQLAWTLRAASQLAEEAAAAVDGWKYQLGEEGVNGCRMASFDMLNAQIPNEKGILQYQQVLADLGRLEVSADLQPPTVCTSASESELGHENVQEEVEADAHPPANVGRDAVRRSEDIQSVSPAPSQRYQEERPQLTSCPKPAKAVSRVREVEPLRLAEGMAPVAAGAVAEGDMPQLRPSHMSEVPSQLPKASTSSESTRAGRSTEIHLTSGTGGISVGLLRDEEPRPATSARSSVPRSLIIGGFRGQTTLPFSTHSRATSSASQVRAALDALEKKDTDSCSASSASYARSTNGLRLRSEDAAHYARDTMPFRVSMPQKRVLSIDRTDDFQLADSSNINTASSSSWRALKLHRASSMQNTASAELAVRRSSLSRAPYASSSGASSAWQMGGPTRLSFFSEYEVCKLSKSSCVSPVRGLSGDAFSEEHREMTKRRTTGLHLEL
ncbi:hypothetical protein ABL78_2627 [Leptomonas seymouri]|uniref:B box-type domain-containing protein n=1 Tax=Leptomonas seymouri TaxID=5684 RepID=A0A0N1HZ00_LEPSE|nr:hypothetical protein ABL78_2627 [Leptomonas seymouri]|eukprot:KPI88265.1 hypothetical protein ABL78_2627 [Leptomonas seymouri]